MGGVQRIVIPYSPREQFLGFHNRKQRWACVVTHVRAGKTVACINDLVKGALTCKLTDPRFAYVAPYYTQAKDVAWNYLKRFTATVPGVQSNEAELRVDFPNGGRVRLYGADNYDRMRGIYLDGVVLDEPADMHPAAWPEVIRPRLSDRGGWGAFIGTPKGRNEFFDIREEARANPGEWYYLELRADQTGILNEQELADAQKSLTPEQYAQEYLCSFDAAITGAYYGKEIADAEREGRICELPPDPILPVHTAWDLGKTDSTSIWFWQMSPNGIRAIDFYENQSFDLDHYTAELKSRGYKYGTHYLPHDARAGILGMKRTRIEQLMELMKGDKFAIVKDHAVMDGINAARLTLKRTWFDADKCKFALEALRQYRTEYDDKAKVFKTTPKHDWTSHCADSFRYLCMAWRELIAEPAPKPKPRELTYLADEKTGTIQSNISITELIRQKERKARRGL